ncbi:MAG: XdhC family protein [Armatimonadetes bacterium]|nr:XdhC family protein [Armatimonadota bacterium]
MDTIFRDIAQLLRTCTPCALATVVHTAGSTPQKEGARAVFLADGRVLGTLGGGCMEAEARRKGLMLLRGGAPDLLALHLDDDFGWDDGLICGGTASIFLQPADRDAAEVYEAALALQEARARGVFALIVAANNPDLVGRACLYREGAGTVTPLPDTALQAALAEAAAGLLREGREDPQRVALPTAGATAYLEPILPAPALFIAGAGHVGAALCHYAARAGFRVVVCDDRPSFANAERLPDAAEVIVDDIVATVRRWPKHPDTYFVLVTRGHRHDAVALREIIHTPVAYIGMIGSRRKVLTVYDQFLKDGLATPEQLVRVHAPVGLNIGARTVDEIAISIVAELIWVRRKGRTDGHSDPVSGGGIAADGCAEAAAAARAEKRDRACRPLSETLPDRRAPRGAGAPARGD